MSIDIYSILAESGQTTDKPIESKESPEEPPKRTLGQKISTFLSKFRSKKN